MRNRERGILKCFLLVFSLVLATIGCEGGGDGVTQPTQLTVIPGDPNTTLNGNLPDIFFPEASEDNFTLDPDTGLLTSRTRILVLFRNGVTIGQANTTLQSIDAVVIGSIPSINLLLVEIPDTGDLSGLKNALTILGSDSNVAFAVQDTEIGFSTISAPSNQGIWTWPPLFSTVPIFQTGGGMNPSPAQDGNWGLESARAPQMWNLNDPIEKSGITTQTGVLDVGFQSHNDLGNLNISGAAFAHRHGNHVSGIVGATFDNRFGNMARGIDGINPFAAMTGFDALGPALSVPSIGSNIINALVSMLNNFPQLRVVNISLGYNWGPNTGGGINPNTNVNAQRVVIGHGLIMRLVAASNPNVILVSAAGNDSSTFFGYPTEIHAKWSSPINWAALEGAVIIFASGTTPLPPPPLPPIITQPSPPTAGATASVIFGEQPIDVLFFGEGFDPDGGEVSFSWDFDEDGISDSGDQNPSFTYTTPGKRMVTLTVEDDEGVTSTASLTINVSANDPAVQIALPSSTLNPLTVQFEADVFDSVDGTLSYSWDFGDGQTSDEQAPNHTYSSSGTFSVLNEVTDGEGGVSEASMTILVIPGWPIGTPPIGGPPGFGFIILPPSPNIIVVEAIQNIIDTLNTPACAVANQFCKADFSNVGGHITAPGRRIMSTVLGNGYGILSGTSMAAPHVTGLIGYMLAFDPSLSVQEVKSRLTGNSHNVNLTSGENPMPPSPPNDVQPNAFPLGMFRVIQPPPVTGSARRIDAFEVVLGIDSIRAGEPVQHAFVDTDDGTIDGNDRTVAADARGDDRVSMRDFRRFRDAYLITKSEAFPAFNPLLDPSLLNNTNLKNDLNRDGCVLGNVVTGNCASQENVYSRFDFNGSGVIDDRLSGFKGMDLLDVEIIAHINLWEILDRVDDVKLNEEVSVDPADELATDINPNQDIVLGPTHWLLADRLQDSDSDGTPDTPDGRTDYLYSCDLEFVLSFASPETDFLSITIMSDPWFKRLGYDSTPSAPIAPTDPVPLPLAAVDRFIVTVPLYEQAITQGNITLLNGHSPPPGQPNSAFILVHGIDIKDPADPQDDEITVSIEQEVCTMYGEDVTIQINVP